MKMQLNSLVLDNFKCYGHLELRLEGRSADVFGDNNAGKTTLYDAFTWLLFGKDSLGRSNFDIKPVDGEGQVKDHAAVTAVEAELSVDGARRTLKRTYYELWATRRGSAQASFDGHSSDYFVDDVPCKKGEFTRRVGELIDEDAFRLLTDVSFFSEKLPWQDRRAALFKMASVVGDEVIMAGDERFAPLALAADGLGLDDYRKKLLAQRKRLNGVRTDIPARLDECRKSVEDLAGIDFEALEGEKAQAQERWSQARAAVDRTAQAQDGGRRELAQELNQTELELRELENQNTSFRLEQKAAMTASDELGPARRKLAESRCAADRARRDLERLRSGKAQAEERIARFREEWNTINAERFQGGVCPTCGQTLPESQLKIAKDAFERSKARRKQDTVDSADALKRDLAGAAQDIEKTQAWLSECEEEARRFEDKVRELEAHPSPEITDMPDYEEKKAALQERIGLLRGELVRLRDDRLAQCTALAQDAQAAQRELERIQGELAKKSALQYAEKRMDELREQAAAAERELDEADKMLDLLEQFTRYKARFVEDSVNQHFQLARFRLFREQVNGGVEDCCEVTVDGVAYSSGLNEGAKVNAGMDIINTLSRFYDARVPLFVDNAERVTRLLNVDTQVIRLVVSEYDQELRCELK